MEHRQDEIIPFKVFVRVRPLTDKERTSRPDKIVRYEDQLVGTK